MHAIIRQAKANLRGHKLQTWLIFLTLLGAAMLFTLALSTFRTAQGAYDRLFERSHGAHLWLELNPARVSAAAAEEALGYAIGLPAGVAGISLLIDTVARMIGFGPLRPPMDGTVLALLLPVAVLIAVVGAFIPARRASRVSVVEMLR